MVKLFVDTYIVVDLFSKRNPFYIEAQELFSIAVENKNITLYISALTIANTHYILSKFHNTFKVREILSKIQPLVSILSLDDGIITKAINSNFKDFEDAIQFYSAEKGNVDYIITRNKKDFETSSIPLLTAKEYITYRMENN